MKLEIHQLKKQKMAVYTSAQKLDTVEDIVDLLGNAYYLEASSIVINKEYLDDSFFDLKTGIAGEILQKFSNYRCRLAIVGDFTAVKSRSLREFIGESNRYGRIIFVGSVKEAMAMFDI